MAQTVTSLFGGHTADAHRARPHAGVVRPPRQCRRGWCGLAFGAAEFVRIELDTVVAPSLDHRLQAGIEPAVTRCRPAAATCAGTGQLGFCGGAFPGERSVCTVHGWSLVSCRQTRPGCEPQYACESSKKKQARCKRAIFAAG